MTERLAAALAERYRIERELGAGGMAIVYLAADLKHDRKVAIKVLKPELAAVLGAERFVQEIKTTAALSHPHILPLFDSGTAEGFLFYVMPYIKGETIRERMNRETQFGVDEAVRIAREVADALDYAHRNGVIHRDIKPENILLHDGRAMVMDFGIALAVSAAAGGRMTETGLSLGTPHYMSPEQATADKEISGRSDIYSLASVLYEMLAGQPPHLGGSAQQIIMKIIAEPVPPVTALRKSVPPNVAAALATALEKLPADRFEDARAFAAALANPAYSGGAAATRPVLAGRSWGRDPRTWVALVAVTVTSLMAFLPDAGDGSNGDRSAPVLSARLALPAGERIVGAGADRRLNADRPSRTAFAFSPDGGTIVFVGMRGGVRQLLLRPLTAEASAPIVGTEEAESPFFSPDGRSIAYWANDRLMRVPVAGGTPTEVARVGRITGGTWSEDDRIVVGVSGTGLLMVSPTGAFPMDTVAGSGAILPHFLPGGEALLLTEQRGLSGFGLNVSLLRLADGEITRLISAASDARYVPSGHLVFARSGAMFAVSFDLRRRVITGTPTLVLSDLMVGLNGYNIIANTGAMQAAISAQGHLLYLEGGVTPDRPFSILSVDRAGRASTLTAAGVRDYFALQLSPDERRLAVGTRGLQPAVLVYDLDRGSGSLLTAPGRALWPLWTPDGQRIIRLGVEDDTAAMIWSPADGSRPAVPLLPGKARSLIAAFWAPDGDDLYAMMVSEDRLVRVDTASGEVQPVPNLPEGASHFDLSADGRWLSYTAPEPGMTGTQVFVQPWPALDRRWQVSVDGGVGSKWTKNGRELLFTWQVGIDTVSGQRVFRVFAVPIITVPGFAAGSPQKLFDLPFGVTTTIRSWDAISDGSRIFVLSGQDLLSPPGEPRLLVNWLPTLRALGGQGGNRK
jgi:serine/threonine-protein kinase